MQNLEAEIEGLTHLLGAIASQVASQKVFELAIPTSSAPTCDPEIELVTKEEMKS